MRMEHFEIYNIKINLNINISEIYTECTKKHRERLLFCLGWQTDYF